MKSNEYLTKEQFSNILLENGFGKSVENNIIEKLDSNNLVYFFVSGVINASIVSVPVNIQFDDFLLEGYVQIKSSLLVNSKVHGKKNDFVTEKCLKLETGKGFKLNMKDYSKPIKVKEEKLHDLISIMYFFGSLNDFDWEQHNFKCFIDQRMAHLDSNGKFYKLDDINYELEKFNIDRIEIEQTKYKADLPKENNKNVFRGERNLKFALYAMANILAEEIPDRFKKESSGNINIAQIGKRIEEYLEANKDNFMYDPRMSQSHFQNVYSYIKKNVNEYIEDVILGIEDKQIT